jgi:hypothetical protein
MFLLKLVWSWSFSVPGILVRFRNYFEIWDSGFGPYLIVEILDLIWYLELGICLILGIWNLFGIWNLYLVLT